MGVKQRVHRLLEVGGATREEQVVDWGIMALIAANVMAVILSTVDALYAQYSFYFRAFEVISVTVFSVEYLGRIWAVTVRQEYANPIMGRLRYALRPMLIIDLLAILPFYVGFFFVDLRFLRALRLFRFFRLLKLARYSQTIQAFKYVLKEKREDLIVAVSATLILLVLSSSMMYFFEHEAQPEAFSSIPETFWWGVVTLTTVGYGDVYPVTFGGRVFAAVVAFLGVGLFALPASILSSGFVDQARSSESETMCPHCGEVISEEH
ncbi:potassium channel protein [Haloferax sp. Atlit-6N]|uniref:ion transporter n=1 Tax=Haloferax sp. Atlit-6N TaxID=2077205 RepID=UPI000E24D5CB|nr:ion transporter [Haloferax sp. Atlit-6N]REA05779.1 potassium channel protein [Haloferax sp. Atlit-6N]